MTSTALKDCPNCSADLETTANFCPNCGQSTHLHRFNLAHIGHEFFHAFTHADKSIFHLIRSLAVRPGVTAREYVLAGKRKKYFNPFSFLLIVLRLNISVNILIRPYTNDFAPRNPSAQQAAPNVPPAYRPYVERQRAATAFVEKRINLIGLLAIPVFALVFWLFFWRTHLNYAEHLVAQVFFASFFSLVSIVVTLLLGFVFSSFLSNLNSVLLLFQLVYLTVAYYQFLDYQQPRHYVKTGLATVLALAVWFAISGGAIYLYVRFGG